MFKIIVKIKQVFEEFLLLFWMFELNWILFLMLYNYIVAK